MENKVSFSLYLFDEDQVVLETYLKSLGFSKNKIKKSSYTKKQLERKFKNKELLDIDIDLLNSGKINSNYTGVDIQILNDSEEFLVIHKPAGVHAFSQVYSQQDTALNFLCSQNKRDILKVAQDTHERGFIHRLDKETSGVMIAVKSQSLWDYFRQDFANRAVDKKYIACVDGRLEHQLKLEHHLSPTGTKGHKMKVEDGEVNAILDYQILNFDPKSNTTRIEIKLLTGMRHQIRTQLSHIGHPIQGDKLYGGSESSRLKLHAKSYRLKLPDDSDIEFTCACEF